jgi:pilus assembly protein Flp/PilA
MFRRKSFGEFLPVRAAVRNRSGVSAFEYGLVAALIAVLASVAISNLGTTLTGRFRSFATALKSSQ